MTDNSLDRLDGVNLKSLKSQEWINIEPGINNPEVTGSSRV